MRWSGKSSVTDPADRLEQPARDELIVAPGRLGAIKQTLNRSGWLADEVIAAGEMRQGNPLSRFGMLTGAALVELARPRRSKTLPRHCVLAMTADRVLAFKASSRDGGTDSGPHKVVIHPGGCGSWSRASTRLTDLARGAESIGGTLELGGVERLPIALSLDRDSEELADLLRGGRAGSEAKTRSSKEARHEEDREALSRASEVRPADYRELAADAVRGRPEVDLRGWADRRGLDFRGSAPQGGHLSVTCPWSKDVLFNVVRGHWPEGHYGVLCHETRLYETDVHGFFHGGEVFGGRDGARWTIMDELGVNPVPFSLQDLRADSGRHYFKVPYTSAGTRVPHLATVSGVHVARRAERYTHTWQTRPLDDLGLTEPWIAAIRPHSDQEVVERLLSGPIRKLLGTQQGLGFEIRIEYGQVIISRQDFLKRDQDLDELVKAVEELADGVRSLCVPRSSRTSLTTPLEPPEWLQSARRHPKRQHILWPIDARLEPVVKIADERDMTVEDPRAFHRAFPDLNFPGQAFGVLRGRLPGTALTGRLLCCVERPMVLPEDFRKFLTNPGGAVGSDVAVLPLSSEVPATPFEGELDGGLRFVVADGVLTAWRARYSWQASGESLDRLAADVAGLIDRRGLPASAASSAD